eukprot:4672195-Pyramimonas_sp.AAC.1
MAAAACLTLCSAQSSAASRPSGISRTALHATYPAGAYVHAAVDASRPTPPATSTLLAAILYTTAAPVVGDGRRASVSAASGHFITNHACAVRRTLTRVMFERGATAHPPPEGRLATLTAEEFLSMSNR